jgi:hypothetical protein
MSFVYLILASLELVEKSFVFKSRVEFSRVVNDENDIGSVDKPLDDIVEWVRAVDLLADLQDTGYFNNVDLFEELVGQSLATKSIDESLAKLLEAGEGPVGSQLGTVQHFLRFSVHQNLEEGG